MDTTNLIIALAAKDNFANQWATDNINLASAGFTDAMKKGGRIEKERGSFSARRRV